MSVQLVYSRPLNRKGNLQYSPSAFPYFTRTTEDNTGWRVSRSGRFFGDRDSDSAALWDLPPTASSLVPSEQIEGPEVAREATVLVARDSEARRGPERRPGHDSAVHFLTLSFSQGPQLIVVKVGVSPDAGARGKGMSQEPVLAIKRVSVSMLCNT